MFLIISLFIHISVLFSFVLNMKECPISQKNESIPYRKEVFKRYAKPENAFTSLPNTLKDNLYYSTLLYSIENLFRDQHKPQKRAKNHNKTGKFKKLISGKKSKQEDEAKIAKHLTEKLFQLFKKLDLGVNNDLITDLRHLKEKFNIADTSEDEISRYGAKNEKPLDLPVDKSETNETPLEDTDEEMTQTSELITTEQNEYSNDYDSETTANEGEYESDSHSTTVSSANEADYYETTIQNNDEGDDDYDDEVEFRQKSNANGKKGKGGNEGKGKSKEKGAKKKDDKDKTGKAKKKQKDNAEKENVNKQKGKEKGKGKPKDKNKKKAKGKDKKKGKKTEKDKKKDKGKGKTSGKDEEKEKKDGKTQKDENLSDENSSTEEVTQSSEKAIKKPSSETKPVPSNDDEDDEDDDVITIRRVRGIWLGGHCRCNYFIRSSANNISTNLIAALFCIYFFKLNKYL